MYMSVHTDIQKKFNYLPFDGRGNPSNVHEICGVGFPAAEHFKLTAGPGCNVCSIKLYSKTGGASAVMKIIKKKKTNAQIFQLT